MKLRLFILIFLFNLISAGSAIAQDAGGGGGDGGEAGPGVAGGNAEANASTPASVMNGRGGSSNSGPSVQADEFSGAATYSIQIGVPPGRGSMEPNLTLNYHSYRRNRNSWVGYGWDLDLGSITRTSDTGAINFEVGQNFQAQFGGQSESLVLVSDNVDAADYGLNIPAGAQVSQYAAKYESSYNIYLHIFKLGPFAGGNAIAQDFGWVVIDKAGKRYIFGDTSNARDERYRVQDQQLFPLIGRWLLRQVNDPNGNHVEMQYGDDLLPDTVTYQDIVIEFVKKDRENYFPIFRESFLSPIEISKYLDAIIIKSHGERLQKYQFSYSDSWDMSGFYQLLSAQQFGKDDDTSLPPNEFRYNGEGSLKFSPQSFNRQASRQAGDQKHKGYLNKQSELMDMDGDGLVDQVVAFKKSDTIHVYFNDGNDFVDRGAQSLWKDPEDFCNDTWKCQGLLRQEKMRKNVPRTWLFMMDMNGDHLPDRVRQDKQDGVAGFLIALNTGKGFAQNLIFWRDPEQGGNQGRLSRGSGLMDMNGDGLPDRILGDRKHSLFNVFLNTGSGFAEESKPWFDPLYTNHTGENDEGGAAGHLYRYDDGGRTKVSIRDFNGDGLPDRIWKEEFFKVGEEEVSDPTNPEAPPKVNRVLKSLGKGFMVALNRNGEGWAQPSKCEHADGEHQELDQESCQRFNNTDILAFLDPIHDGEENHNLGVLSNTYDLVDFNSDGYLDRVQPYKKDGKKMFRVYFYHGTKWNDAELNPISGFSEGHDFEDPIEIADGEENDKGSLLATNNNGEDTHTFLRDIDGDGYPDRVSMRNANNRDENKTYEIYPMQARTLTYSDSPAWWNNKKINQPVGSLYYVRDSMGGVGFIEYEPSAWPKVQGVHAHRFLPFNLSVAHKIYTTDYTARVQNTAESLRHPHMRITKYEYEGGNALARLPVSPHIPADPLKQYTFRFNGFRTVNKIIEPNAGETWSPYETKTYYHQTMGDLRFDGDAHLDPLEQASFAHDALSGKPYLHVINETNGAHVEEESTWTVANAIEGDDFKCAEQAPGFGNDLKSCFPLMTREEKRVREPNSPNLRISGNEYEYSTFGNVTLTRVLGPGHQTLLEKHSEFYDSNHFDPTLKIRSFPSRQIQSLNGQNYREKRFDYDARGNPTQETYVLNANGNNPTITRSFDAQTGNLVHITNMDGISKEMIYDPEGLFPIEERTFLAGNQFLRTTRQFNRLLGKPSLILDNNGVGKKVIFDDFARPIEEYSINSQGAQTLLTKNIYEYVEQNVEGVANTTLFKTTSWQPVDGQPDTDVNANPMSITYTDASQNLLQECTYSERGNYRLGQGRILDGGRQNKSTEPVFTNDCQFISRIPQEARVTTTFKDFQGRTTRVEPPQGDANSPVQPVTFSNETNALGHLVKRTFLPNNQTKVEEFDEKDRLLSVTDTQGSTLNYEFNPVGDLLHVSALNRVLTEITYDNLGRKVSMTDADMGTWSYTYDRLGRLSRQTDAKGQTIEFSYTTLGRVLQKQFFDNHHHLQKIENSFYDAGNANYAVSVGELYKVEEFDGHNTLQRTTKFGYEPLFHRNAIVTRDIPGLGAFSQTLEYSPRGLLTKTTYPGGQELFQRYGRTAKLEKACSRETCDNAKHEVYYSVDQDTGYDVFGGLVEETYGNGVKTGYTYYPNSHRLSSKRTFLGDTTYSNRTYTFDALANITSYLDPLNSLGSGAISHTSYDSLNRLTSYQYANENQAKRLNYDARGNILLNESSYGNAAYQYNSQSPHAVTDIGDNHFTYDENGNMASDPSRRMEYDAGNKLTRVTMQNGNVVDYAYDYSGGRVTKHSTTRDASNRVHESTTHYLGDALEIKDGNAVLHIAVGDRRVATMSMGPVNQMAGAGGTLQNRNVELPFGPQKMMSFILLGMTCLLILSLRPVPIPVLHWIRGPARSRLNRASRAYSFCTNVVNAWAFYTTCFQEFVHSFSRRTGFAFLTLLFIAQSTILMPSEAQAGERATTPSKESSYFFFVHDDELDSSHLLTEGMDETQHAGITYKRGDLLQRYEYSPFGQEKFVLNPNLRFDPRFTGQEYDLETGLYYFKARFYDPKLARFIQPDTVVPGIKNLQAYNRYSYTLNNPLKYNDPSGHGAALWRKIVGAFVGALIAALSFYLGPIGAMAGILVGGVIGGAIAGGAKGALAGLIGAALTLTVVGSVAYGGARGGWRGALMAYGMSVASSLSQVGGIGIVIGIGISLAIGYATGGWQGMAVVGAGIGGGMTGAAIGNAATNGRSGNTDLEPNTGGPNPGDEKFVENIISKNLDTDQVSTVSGRHLEFDGKDLNYYGDDNELLGSYPATSGRNGITDPHIQGQGPIPSGSYSLNPQQISEGGFLRNLTGDWGQYRSPLTPNPGTNTFGRSGFFIHGGRFSGSAGCIDIGTSDRILFPALQRENHSINVIVGY